ncbi:MAG: hypothetical protein FJW79_05515 [Actinobacteria bacterium]|nr:hypothetical protein [Actinomycetota bacterium]
MGFYRRNRSLSLIVLGTGLMAASVCWEYARVRPDYRYLVEPWSIRGYQTTQGWVILATALALLALALPLGLRWFKGRWLESALVAAGVTAFATMVPVVAKAPEHAPGGVVIWGLAALLGLAALALVRRALPTERLGWWRRPILLGVFAAVTALGGMLVYALLFGDRDIPLWILVLILMTTVSVLVIARTPHELAPYRLLLAGIVLAWIVALVSAGAVRSTLLRLQVENMGISTQYRDVQITSGVLIAWVGGFLAVAGSVALWARRRDELEEHTRAGRQMAVAEISAAEMEAAV